LEDLQVTSIDDALQGRMAGVDIVATSGEPGAGMSIRIRGTTSINSSSDPLIVVDGIPFETTIDENFDFATANEEQYATLLNVAPADIEEIVVLKDAAATAIWGSQGANGVLQIKTKRGTISKPRVQYAFKGTLENSQKTIPTLNGDQYTSLIMEAKQNTAEAGIGTAMTPLAFPEFFYDPKNPYFYYNFGQNTDWTAAVTKDGFTQDHNVSLSGGGDKARYRMSLGYLRQDGTVIGQTYDRLTSRVNLDYFVSDKVRFSADIAYTWGDKEGNYATDVLSKSYTKMPNQSIFEYTNSGEWTPVYFSPEITPQGTWSPASDGGIYNPLAMANASTNRVISERMVPTLTLQYLFIPEIFRYQLEDNMSGEVMVAFSKVCVVASNLMDLPLTVSILPEKALSLARNLREVIILPTIPLTTSRLSVPTELQALLTGANTVQAGYWLNIVSYPALTTIS